MSEDSDPATDGDAEQTDVSLAGTEPTIDPEGNRRVGVALVLLLVSVVAFGLLRPFYPGLARMAIAALLILFGVYVGVLAFRERGQE